MSVADTILEQLGGNKFVAMTGSKNFVSGGSSLSMKLAGNKSRANRLKITLTALDDYTMEFIRITKPRVEIDESKIKSLQEIGEGAVTFVPGKLEKIETVSGVFCDQLQEVFTRVTGLDTSL